MDSQKLTPDFNCIPWKTLIGKIFMKMKARGFIQEKELLIFTDLLLTYNMTHACT